MASSVSAEKLDIFVCRGGTFVTVYAAGSVKSGGITGLAFVSTNGEPKVGCRGELLPYCQWASETWIYLVLCAYSGRLRSSPKTVKSCPTASAE